MLALCWWSLLLGSYPQALFNFVLAMLHFSLWIADRRAAEQHKLIMLQQELIELQHLNLQMKRAHNG